MNIIAVKITITILLLLFWGAYEINWKFRMNVRRCLLRFIKKVSKLKNVFNESLARRGRGEC